MARDSTGSSLGGGERQLIPMTTTTSDSFLLTNPGIEADIGVGSVCGVVRVGRARGDGPSRRVGVELGWRSGDAWGSGSAVLRAVLWATARSRVNSVGYFRKPHRRLSA